MFMRDSDLRAQIESLHPDGEPSADELWQLTLDAAAEDVSDPVVLPAGLDSWLPSPHLAAVLSVVEVGELSYYHRITLLKAQQRLVSHYQAKSYETMSSVHDAICELEPGDPDDQFRLAAAEIRAGLRLTAKAANSELNNALDLKTAPYIRVWKAMKSGVLDRRRAMLIIHRTIHLDSETAETVVPQILEEAAEMTSGEIIARLEELSISADPDEAEKRQEKGVTERRVVPEKNWDGTANYMGLQLRPESVAAAHRRINRIARKLKTSAEPRTMDQLRADVFIDLLLGTHTKTSTEKGKAEVDIRVPLTTVTGEDDQPGEIPGWGPVLADAARQIVAEQENGHWKVTVIDPDTGRPLAAVSTRRRPTAHQSRQVQARHQTCAHPGCRLPAEDCDLDHSIPWAQGGPTTTSHLVPLCRGDHITHHLGWTYQINPDGTITWTSRLGHKYTTRPWKPP